MISESINDFMMNYPIYYILISLVFTEIIFLAELRNKKNRKNWIGTKIFSIILGFVILPVITFILDLIIAILILVSRYWVYTLSVIGGLALLILYFYLNGLIAKSKCWNKKK